MHNFFKKQTTSLWSQFFFVIKMVGVLAILYFGIVAIYIWSLDCTKCPY